MPNSVDESLEIGLHAPVVPPAFAQTGEEGLEITAVKSEEALKDAVSEGRFAAGVALPADIMDRFSSGQKPRIILYFTSDSPEEIKDAVETLMIELAYLQTGQALAIDISQEILGPDTVGAQTPPRDRLLPLFALLLIIVETFGLANLISNEVERRTVYALLVTPVSVSDLFAAKGLTGTGIALGQAALFVAIVGGMGEQPAIILAALLLGAVLGTGVSFLVASLSKDLMSVMAWGVIAFIILIIPAFSVLFPGTTSGWIMAIPSYYLVDTIRVTAGYGAGWGDIWVNLVALLGFDLAIIWLGIAALRRKLL